MKSYKTNNFLRIGTWIRRLLFVSGFGFLFYSQIIGQLELTNGQLSIYFSFLLLLVVLGQIDELEIDENEIIISQKAILPFLRSKRVFQLDDIRGMKKNGKTILADNIVISMLFRSMNSLEITFTEGRTESISSKLHKKGVKGLKAEIEKRSQSKKQHLTY